MFSVTVLNGLTAPIDTSTVKILVFVRGAENFEFANPKSYLGDTSTSPPPSFFAVQAKDEVDLHGQEAPLGDSGSSHPDRYAQNFGEAQKSLRALLHRQSIYDVSSPYESTKTLFIDWLKSYSRLPPSYGYDPNSSQSAPKILAGTGTSPFNYNPTHPIAYLANMYGGYRGSVNYTANPASDLIPYLGDVRVQRVTDTTLSSYRKGAIYQSTDAGLTSTNCYKYINTTIGTAGGGAAFTNTQTNGAIMWNAPHLNGMNFHFCDPYAALGGYAGDQSTLECTTLEVRLRAPKVASATPATTTITTYAGTGPDYTLLWLLCCPTVDYYVSNP